MSLIAWYKLDGNAVNSVTGNSGTVDTFVYTDGKIGKGVLGDGTSVRYILGEKCTITGDFTMSVWARKNGTCPSGAGGIAGTFMNTTPTKGFGLFFHDLYGNYQFTVDTSNGITRTYYSLSTSVANTYWNHYCLVYKDGWVSAYFNGTLRDRRQLTIVCNPEAFLCIGRWSQSYNSYYINGNVDDVRVYDHAISAKEVEELSRAKILHYKFDSFQEPTTNMVPDISLSPYGPYHSLSKTGTSVSMTLAATGATYLTMSSPSLPATTLYGKTLSFSGYIKKNGVPLVLTGGKISTYYQNSGRFYFDQTSGYFEVTQLYDVLSTIWMWHCPVTGNAGDVITITNFQIEEKYHSTPFTESSRTAVIPDLSGYGNDITIPNNQYTPAWESDGKFGRGKYIFGKDINRQSYITLASNDTINCKRTVTISLWFKINAWSATYTTIFGKTLDDSTQRTYSIFVKNDGSITAAIMDNTTTQDYFEGVPGSVILGQWHHFALVVDRDVMGTMVGFLDSVAISTTPITYLDNITHSYPLNIGERTNIYGATLADIDDVRMYAIALSDEDVLSIYKSRGSIDADGNLHAVSLVETNHTPLLCNYTTWTVGTGNVGEFSLNGTTDENMRLLGRDPWNKETVLWEARKVDTTPDADGGWGGNAWTAIDNTKTYRFSCWIKRSVIGNGSMYWGLWATEGVLDSSTLVLNGNPYFHYSGIDSTEWILYVGHVHPVGYIGPHHPDSGRYLVSGKLGGINHNYVFQATTTAVTHRAYLYYSSDITTRQQFVYPRIDLCDGNEPTITELLEGHDSRNVDLIRSIGGTNPINMHVGPITHVNTISEIGPTDSLLAYYPLDGDIKDYSCNNLHGTTNSGAVVTTGINNKKCYLFDGVDDAIICGSVKSLVNTTNNSWTCWCYPHTHTNTYSMVYGTYLPYMGMLSTGVFRFSANISGTQRVLDTGVRTDNSWYNVVFTYDGSMLRSYINGVQSTSASNPGVMVFDNPSALFSIGHWNNVNPDTFFFDGKIQDVRVYNKTLTDEEIMTLYQVTNPVTTKIKLNKRRVYLGGKIKETF